MFPVIYVEREAAARERTRSILKRWPGTPVVECGRYGEVFNRRAQNFRLQKRAPALILAVKHGRRVLPAPPGYGFDPRGGFYFSHMLNCPYDCRYCFLQGMYRSAHHVLFVNYEDFARDIEEAAAGGGAFYSGYDCDSLALEPLSGFCGFFVPLFRRNPQAALEIRTRSTQVRALLGMEPAANCVVAMSLSPEGVARRWERGAPALGKRLDALARLAAAGWPVALRFEPVLAEPAGEDAAERYRRLFAEVFARIDAASVHSVSLGEYRMPERFHRNIARLYPEEPLFARPVDVRGGRAAFPGGAELLDRVERALLEFVGKDRCYRCA